MSKGPSRRQWLLGLVGGMFGATAAQALDRVLPGKLKEEPAPVGWLCWTVRPNEHSSVSHCVPLQGRVSVEPASPPGTFSLVQYDGQGREVLRVEGGVTSVWVESTLPPPIMTFSTYIGGKSEGTHYAYDAVDRLTGSVTTVTYASRGNGIDPLAGPDRTA